MAASRADDSSSPISTGPLARPVTDFDDSGTVCQRIDVARSMLVTPSTGISIEQATDSILRAGLLNDTSIAEACHELKTSGIPLDGEHLLDYLTKSGRLTSWQAMQVGEGKCGDLVLGNYVILSRIGQGGMGAVYKALHRRMKRVVALKIIRKGRATPEFIERFRREIEAAARLTHPNVIAAYDADECELGDFLVMEFVDGSDMREIVEKSGTLPISDALRVMREAALALGYAHSQGIVHRDIKPANLMRDINGVTKLADLGLARLIEPGGTSDAGSGLTEAGIVAGTIDYMPPEQANDSRTADHRADIYSLGCTFFFLLTGAPPFPGGTALERILAHRDAPPPSLLESVPDATPELEALFLQMMAKDRNERFQSMAEVVSAIDALQPDDAASNAAVANRAAHETTVLIVEQSKLQAGMISRLLTSNNIDDIHVAASATDAIEKLAVLHAHIVLVSSQLPDMSGLQLAERIREELRWARVPVLIMASNATSNSVRDAIRRIGATDVIQKPFDATQIGAAINDLLSSEPGESGVLSALASQRVLIVDDSSVARRRIQQTLSELGFVDFTGADDGAHGVEMLKQERFDLVITDYNMPNMDGRQFVGWIRSQSAQRNVPIIMVTTEFDPSKLAQIYQLGVSAICGKSFERDMVRNIVIRLFL